MNNYSFYITFKLNVKTGNKLKATAKRSQHFNATYSNIVWRNMVHAFGHPLLGHAASCCDMLRVVGSNLKMVKFFAQHLLDVA